MRVEAEKVKLAERRLRIAILAAQDSGESTRDIAPYAGLSPARIHQIVVQERRAQELQAE